MTLSKFVFEGDPPNITGDKWGQVITYKRHPTTGWAAPCPSLPPKSGSTGTMPSFRGFRKWKRRGFEGCVASRFRRDPCKCGGVPGLWGSQSTPTYALPKLKMEFLKMMVPKEITVPFSDSMLNLWEGRGMNFFIEIKPFLLVKLREMSEIMKYDTNPNFIHV